MKPDNKCDLVDQMEYKNSYGNNRVRVIRLRRNGSTPLGFSVRGGKEHGTGIFVSEVQAGSEAHHQGLQIGDQILRVNGFNIEHAIHEEVLNLLRAKPGVVLKVKSVGMIPVKNSKKDPLTWKIVDPTQSCPSFLNGSQSSSCASSLDEQNETKITITAVGASGLGCRQISSTNGHSNENNNSGCHTNHSTNSGNIYDHTDCSQFNGNVKDSTTQLIKVSATVHAVNESERINNISDGVRECGDGMENIEEDVCNSQRDWNADEEKIQNQTFMKEEQSEGKTHSNEYILKKEEKNKINGHRIDFLVELQQYREKRQFSNDEASEKSSLSSEDSRGVQKVLITSEKSKYEEDINKRKQHEMLMEEFREAHKKMFSIQPDKKKLQDRKNFQRKEEQSSLYYRRQQVRDRMTPPLPPPPLETTLINSNVNINKDNNFNDLKNINNSSEIVKEETDGSTASEVGSNCKETEHQGSSYIPPHSPNPHLFVDPSCNAKSFIGIKPSSPTNEETLPLTSKQARRQCLAITDSRGLEAKPPQIYFEKTGSKPLVTIGTYPNSSQQNRFLYPPSNTSKSIISKENKFDLKEEFLTISDENATSKSCDYSFKGHPLAHSSSSSSVTSNISGSSSTSSSSFKPKSPSINSLECKFHITANSRTLASTVTPLSASSYSFVNVPNVIIKETSKNQPPCKLEVMPSNEKRTEVSLKKCAVENQTSKTLTSATKVTPVNSTTEFTEEQTEGRKVMILLLNKNGPLNMRIEGGNSYLPDGRILVSEIWEGGCVLQDGSVEPGDQILKVDNTQLIGVSLTAANAALRNSMCNSEKQLRLVIAKAHHPRPNTDL